MRRGLIIALSCVLLAILGIAGAGAWLLYTEAGLNWALAQVGRAAGNQLSFSQASGTLGSGVTFAQVSWKDPGTDVRISQLRLQVSPASLIRLHPAISEVSCNEIDVHMTPANEPSQAPASLALPIDLNIATARVGTLRVMRGETTTTVTDLQARYSGGQREHHIEHISAAVEGFRGSGELRLETSKPFKINGLIKISDAGGTPVANIRPSGSLLALEVAFDGQHAGARLAGRAQLKPFEEQPLGAADVNVEALDLRALNARLPVTAISGQLSLKPGDGGFSGPLSLNNARPGPYDKGALPVSSAQSHVVVRGSRVVLTGMHVNLGSGGTIRGNSEVVKGALTLNLDVTKLNLKALYSTLIQTSLAGPVRLAMQDQQQTAQAKLQQDGMTIELDALQRGQHIEIRHIRADARGSEVNASGTMDTDGPQAFAARLNFARFNPAAWGSFPAGDINGTVDATGQARNRTVDLNFNIDRSRLNGAALTAKGTAKVAGERLVKSDASLDLGGNRVDLQGAFGSASDVLHVRIDAPKLETTQTPLSGRVTGTVDIAGAASAPEVRFDVQGERLRWSKDYDARSTTLRGRITLGQQQPLVRVSVVARGIQALGWRADEVNLSADGTRAAHALTLTAQGKNYQFVTQANGALHPDDRWTGTITRLQNRGDLPTELRGPVTVEAGRDRLVVGRFAATLYGGELNVRELRYEPGRLVTAGSFARLPVYRLIALGGMNVGALSTLRVSGNWDIARTHRWDGNFAVQRDAGDITLNDTGKAALGMTAATIQGEFRGDDLRFNAALAAALVDLKAEGTLGVPGAALPSATSPLRVTANVNAGQLGTMAALAGATLQVGGRARAAITATGTLGEPQLTGTLTGEQLAFALPPQGIDLRNGELKARLEGRTLRVENFSIRGGDGSFTAKGTLALGDTADAALDWQADRLTVLGRPDRRLVLSGKGRAALEKKRLTLAGSLLADRGLFDISGSDLPTLGDDVVVKGRVKRTNDAARFTAADVDVNIDLGDNLQVRGRGLDTQLRGKLRLRNNKAGELQADGTITTARGTYTAFGQKLQIDRGSIIFNGPLTNPGLDIVALRKNQAVEAGVQVTGTVQAPYIKVTSEPPVPENEALSWLILGRAPGDASRGDLAMLPVAAASLMRKNQGGSDKTIAQRFGLDSVGLRGNDSTGQFVTVGKQLSDQVYVAYEQSLAGAASLLRVELSVSPRVLLRVEAGETSALGVVYRLAFD